MIKEIEKHYLMISEILKSKEFILAGGCIGSIIRYESVNDYDCFFSDEDSYLDALSNIESAGFVFDKERKASKQFSKDGLVINLVLCSLKSRLDIIESFDLKHCCIYFHPNDGIIQINDGVLYLVISKIIEINVSTFPWLTLFRIAKLKSKGWSIDYIQSQLAFDYAMKAPWGGIKESEYVD